MESLARGVEHNRNEAREEEKRERERHGGERGWERGAETELWITPGLRPLAEPPRLDWEQFVRSWIPSDSRYRCLFPNDPEKRATMKDLVGERAILNEYIAFTRAMMDDPEVGDARRRFYDTLSKDLFADWKEVHQERLAAFEQAIEICRFEYNQLDNDNKTTRLENWVNKGANIFSAWGEEVKLKYQYLIPADFMDDPVATFEFNELDRDGGTSNMEHKLESGHDILTGWPQVVQDKYGHLRSLLPRHTTQSTGVSTPIAPPTTLPYPVHALDTCQASSPTTS